ncbi:MAG: XRE family transcriptional regulator [Chloroflexi bacterium]|nr:XRE family transcriptional regulator [Chloroflexota bacterium]MCI0577676.1 XRE family transcriptional regulator [Chloroflexota bacterium]MCI0648058.1 XRE family transcriptional regulator [Chloroflexota bacterium]MCI0732165.1 XRE family transcriptional regulator [Chloroflexota bacterium]
MSTELVNIIFGMKVRQARSEAGLTLSELAAAAELSPSYLTEIEKGRKYPRADKILRMAEALGKEYDDLVSIRLGPSLAYLESALGSPLMREFPFEEFGLDMGYLVELLTRAPDKASALLHAILEIARQYDLKEEYFLRAMLRSYQEIRDNYFPELEEAAAAFAKSHRLHDALPVTMATLQEILEKEFNYELEDTMLAADPVLAGYRAVFVQRRRPRLFINNLLRPMQIKFLLAREIGYHCLGLKERSYTSTPDSVDSFQQVFNDFKASYFAGALLIPRPAILEDVETFFAQEAWQPDCLLDMLARYEVTPEMLCYRFSELIPEFFGLKLHFLRVHRSGDRYRLVKRLNMSQLPIPSGLALHEHYCRRWLSTRLLKDLMDDPAGLEVYRDRPLVGAQMSEFLESHDRFLCIGFARPLVLAPRVGSSVIVGFRDEPDMPRVIRFALDPAIPSVIINETCERCPLTAEQCAVRAAEPIILREQQTRETRQAAVHQLMARFKG